MLSMPISALLTWTPITPTSKHACNFSRTVDLQTECQTRTVHLCHKISILKHINQLLPTDHQGRNGVLHSLHLGPLRLSITIARESPSSSSLPQARHLNCSLLSTEVNHNAIWGHRHI